MTPKILGERYLSGATLRELARETGDSHETIRKLLRIYNIPLRQKGNNGPKGTLQLKFKVTRSVFEQMGDEPNKLAARLITTIIEQNLVKAVLDDGVTE